MLSLAHGLRFEQLYQRDGLAALDAAFLQSLDAADANLGARLRCARAAPETLDAATEAALLIELSPWVDDFVGALFGIGDAVRALSERHNALAPLYECKRQFVQRQAATKVKPDALAGFDPAAAATTLQEWFGEPFAEVAFARHVTAWQGDPALAGRVALALHYAAWALTTPEGRQRHAAGVLFKAPHRTDPQHLVPVETDTSAGYAAFTLGEAHQRHREGFALTDPGTDLVGALDQAHYCIWCHHQGKDSCSKGLMEKLKGDAAEVDALPAAARYKKSPFAVTLAGCPLEERISEFHEVKAMGHAIGALAMIAIDNPMLPATGHRICNDCMKACIYQKTEPVNIPESETRTLKDVLELPWGFEIYSLLTRWNPLDLRRPLPRTPTGRRVLVVGLGPAGFTLAHHLMNDGHLVAGVDGLKIEPLPPRLSGVDGDGRRVPFEPVQDVRGLYESLDDRVMAGFGGVAEYGITVRWNKNFLKVIRLVLERRGEFAMFGGVRFGGTLTAQDAFDIGFDHVALAAGAGRPTILDMPNGLARGVRTASDFLMALQLTGAAKADSIANMQLRLPVVVIGGGLTAVDTATESLAYYPVQVEKFLSRYETLVAEQGEASVQSRWNDEERAIAAEFIDHARAIRAERRAAAAEGRPPRLARMIAGWGGVTLAYRKRMIDSPSYTLNHEEVHKALEEGIVFAEGLSPRRIDVDPMQHVASITMARQALGEDGRWSDAGDVVLPARTVLIAAGTNPNTVLAREDADTFVLDGRYFRACDEQGNPVRPERSISKPKRPDVFLSRREDGRFISFFGDLHPSFFGNVVKAMGSAKQGYPAVSRVLAGLPAPVAEDAGAFLARLNDELRATVHEVNRLTPNIVEVVVKAPRAAARFRPGQFYRLQNYEMNAARIDDTRLAMEGLAMTGAWVDAKRGLVSTIVLEMGGSSDLCRTLRAGEPIVLMGPTGEPTEIAGGETVMLVGGGLGNAVLFSIGQSLRAAGSKVLYFAGYKKRIDRYKVEEIEAAADTVIWCCDEAPGFEPGRPQDRTISANIVEAIAAYADGRLGEPSIPVAEVDRIIAIGSDRMMAAVGAARHGVLARHLKPAHRAIGSINSPMQCMMKEICAQCLQPHRDRTTGQITYVFSCFNQDQSLDQVDFPALNERLRQNSVQEKLTAQWISRCMARLGNQHASAPV
ncbi:MAG: FAD-dependent oxidoreductase [bacterium]|jgi:NADPH-dependent glutamate synthase beta subunit-like oxidoreductase/NAD(P)H-flavin reductase|nr:FAD-dependent oxidoreductase [Betaproteobacteria bacterium]